MGIHPNLVSDTIRELIDDGWVVETERNTASVGRAPVPLEISPESRLALCATYDHHGVVCTATNARGDIIEKVELAHTPDDPQHLVKLLTETLKGIAASCSARVVGVGVADPGMVDFAKGEVVRSSYFPHWHNVPLAGLIGEQFGVSVLVEDASRTRAMAQYFLMPELRQRSSASMLYVDYGPGLGFAFVTSEGVWRGSGFAGELGHVVMDHAAERCGCGARGCLESLVGALAIEAKAKALLDQGVNSVLQAEERTVADAIFSAALDGDRLARGVVEEIMSGLGLAVSFLAAAFHPQYVVIGSDSKAAIRCLARGLSSAIQDRTLPELAGSIRIVEGRESSLLPVAGVALMVFQRAMIEEGQA